MKLRHCIQYRMGFFQRRGAETQRRRGSALKSAKRMQKLRKIYLQFKIILKNNFTNRSPLQNCNGEIKSYPPLAYALLSALPLRLCASASLR